MTCGQDIPNRAIMALMSRGYQELPNWTYHLLSRGDIMPRAVNLAKSHGWRGCISITIIFPSYYNFQPLSKYL